MKLSRRLFFNLQHLSASKSSLEGNYTKMSNIHAKALAASVLLTGSFAALVTPSAATSDPTITPGPNFELFRKQNNDQYMGWVSYSGSWTSAECEAGATYYQSGGHWRCCGTTSAGCEIPQACVNGNLIYNGDVIGASTSVTLAWYVLYGVQNVQSSNTYNI